MNKWIIPSKSLLAQAVLLSPLIPASALLSLFLPYFYFYEKSLGYVNTDLIIICFGFGIPISAGCLWFATFLAQHLYMATRIFKITQDGIIVGVFWKKLIPWDKFTEVGTAPMACGEIRTKYFWKEPPYMSFYLLMGGDSECLPEFGVFSLQMMKFYKNFGKFGLKITQWWISMWMKKPFELDRTQIPETIIWGIMDKSVYNEICKYTANIPMKSYYEVAS